MNSRKDQIDRIEEAFKAVHGKETAVSVGSGWEAGVMRAVRSLKGQTQVKFVDAAMFGRLVWRFALVTCLVALLLTAYTMAIEPGANADVARLFFEDPLAIDVVHSLEAV